MILLQNISQDILRCNKKEANSTLYKYKLLIKHHFLLQKIL